MLTQRNTEHIVFQSANEFSHYIETLAYKENKTHVSAIIEYCDDRDVDIEDISHYISRSLKEKIAIEMQEDGLLPKTSQLF